MQALWLFACSTEMSVSMNRHTAIAKLDKLEEMIACFGAPHPAYHKEFKTLVQSLRFGPIQDSYFREKLFDLEEQAAVGFSTAKFTEVAGGLSQVKVWALGSLGVARSIVEERWPE